MDPAESIPPQGSPLSPAEVEGLLSQVEREAVAPSPLAVAGGQPDKAPGGPVQSHDFRQPAFVSAAELRNLRLGHEEFVRSLAARLSMYLRFEVKLQLSKLPAISYHKFIEGLADPTYLTLFKAEPLRGICLLDIPRRLGLTLVDRLLGGSALAVNWQRELSEIDVALLDQVAGILLGEWRQQWAGLMDLRPVALGHETSGGFVHTSPRDTVMFAPAIEARVGEWVETVQLGFPCSTLEPLVRKLNVRPGAGVVDATPAPATPAQWNRSFEDVNIPVTAEWPGVELSVREVAQLKVGDVIPLSPESANQVQLRLANLPKFVGRLGTRGSHWAVEMTQVLKS